MCSIYCIDARYCHTSPEPMTRPSNSRCARRSASLGWNGPSRLLGRGRRSGSMASGDRLCAGKGSLIATPAVHREGRAPMAAGGGGSWCVVANSRLAWAAHLLPQSRIQLWWRRRGLAWMPQQCERHARSLLTQVMALPSFAISCKALLVLRFSACRLEHHCGQAGAKCAGPHGLISSSLPLVVFQSSCYTDPSTCSSQRVPSLPASLRLSRLRPPLLWLCWKG